MTIKNYFKNLQIIHFAMLSGQVLIFLVLFSLRGTGSTETSFAYATILLFATILGIIGGHVVFKRRLLLGQSEDNLAQKLQHFRAALFLRYGTLEGPFLLSIVLYSFYPIDNSYLLINAVTIVLFFYYRPSAKLAKDLLKLDYIASTTVEEGSMEL